jgi:pimeloyl-ACP methyl ester carboxylesterase
MNGGLYADQHRPLPVQRALRAPVIGALVARLTNERAFARNMRGIFSDEHQPSDEELHELWLGVARRGGQRNSHRLIRYIDERRENAGPWATALERTDRPLLFVWGNADPISGRHMVDEVRRRVPRARVEARDDIGHYPHLEDPAWVAGALLDFL